MKPKDQRVGMNGIATFECHASGNPPPSVFWTKEGSQELMFAGTTHGQMFVTEDGAHSRNTVIIGSINLAN